MERTHCVHCMPFIERFWFDGNSTQLRRSVKQNTKKNDINVKLDGIEHVGMLMIMSVSAESVASTTKSVLI